MVPSSSERHPVAVFLRGSSLPPLVKVRGSLPRGPFRWFERLPTVITRHTLLLGPRGRPRHLDGPRTHGPRPVAVVRRSEVRVVVGLGRRLEGVGRRQPDEPGPSGWVPRWPEEEEGRSPIYGSYIPGLCPSVKRKCTIPSPLFQKLI